MLHSSFQCWITMVYVRDQKRKALHYLLLQKVLPTVTWILESCDQFKLHNLAWKQLVLKLTGSPTRTSSYGLHLSTTQISALTTSKRMFYHLDKKQIPVTETSKLNTCFPIPFGNVSTLLPLTTGAFFSLGETGWVVSSPTVAPVSTGISRNSTHENKQQLSNKEFRTIPLVRHTPGTQWTRNTSVFNTILHISKPCLRKQCSCTPNLRLLRFATNNNAARVCVAIQANDAQSRQSLVNDETTFTGFQNARCSRMLSYM